MNTIYRRYIANTIAKNSRNIAADWLDRLKPVVKENARDIFPTVEYLDHIPSMVEEIATIVGSENCDLALVNSVISRKALQLGKLRHEQKATVSQLLREYDILADILDEFVITQTRDYTDEVSVADALSTSSVINTIIRQILQHTVDAFAERYIGTIREQTERLASFNHLIGHEIRSPLNSALLGLEWVSEDNDLTDEAKADFKRIRSAMLQAASVVDNLESMVHIDGDIATDSPVTQQVDLGGFFSDLKVQLDDALGSRGVSLIIPSDLGSLNIETGKLKLIMTNVLSNAIKYSDTTKTCQNVWIERLDRDDGKVEIHIRDNGLGIPAEQIQDVLKLRVRAHAELDERNAVSGHGLGLFIVDEAVKELGGTLLIESEHGQGTTVRVVLPDSATVECV